MKVTDSKRKTDHSPRPKYAKVISVPEGTDPKPTIDFTSLWIRSQSSHFYLVFPVSLLYPMLSLIMYLDCELLCGCKQGLVQWARAPSLEHLGAIAIQIDNNNAMAPPVIHCVPWRVPFFNLVVSGVTSDCQDWTSVLNLSCNKKAILLFLFRAKPVCAVKLRFQVCETDFHLH